MIDNWAMGLFVATLCMIVFLAYRGGLEIRIRPDPVMRKVIDDLMIKYDAASETELLMISLAMMDAIVHHRMEHRNICTRDQFGYVEELHVINDLDRRRRNTY